MLDLPWTYRVLSNNQHSIIANVILNRIWFNGMQGISLVLLLGEVIRYDRLGTKNLIVPATIQKRNFNPVGFRIVKTCWLHPLSYIR